MLHDARFYDFYTNFAIHGRTVYGVHNVFGLFDWFNPAGIRKKHSIFSIGISSVGLLEPVRRQFRFFIFPGPFSPGLTRTFRCRSFVHMAYSILVSDLRSSRVALIIIRVDKLTWLRSSYLTWNNTHSAKSTYGACHCHKTTVVLVCVCLQVFLCCCFRRFIVWSLYYVSTSFHYLFLINKNLFWHIHSSCGGER